MKQRQIVFSASMVRATMEGRMTQVRKVFAPGNVVTPDLSAFFCQPGDQLWVGEACKAEELEDGLDGVRYLADNMFQPIENSQSASDAWVDLYAYRGGKGTIVPPQYMPRWASRITLNVTGVRVERVGNISLADIKRNGIELNGPDFPLWHMAEQLTGELAAQYLYCARHKFSDEWDNMHKGHGHGFASHPWVEAIDFEPVIELKATPEALLN